MKAAATFATLMCVAFAAPALAQSGKPKPGLWEYTMHMSGGGMNADMGAAQQKMAAEMAKLPPDQRKMVEEMMAKRGVGSTPQGGTTVKSCLTQEAVDREDFGGQRGDCKQEVVSRTASAVSMKLACAGPPPSTGEATITIQSPTAYAMKTVMNTTHDGKPVQMTLDGTGKWLGSDCGSVKPVKRP